MVPIQNRPVHNRPFKTPRSQQKWPEKKVKKSSNKQASTSKHWRKNVANTKKRQSRNAVNINITQMMVGKQRVKR